MHEVCLKYVSSVFTFSFVIIHFIWGGGGGGRHWMYAINVKQARTGKVSLQEADIVLYFL